MYLTPGKNGIIWSAGVSVRISHDDNYILETEDSCDLTAGESTDDAETIIINDRVEGLTDSSVEVHEPSSLILCVMSSPAPLPGTPG